MTSASSRRPAIGLVTPVQFAVLALIAGAVQAQQAPDTPASQTVAQAAPQDSAPQGSAGANATTTADGKQALPQVLVTATKRSTSLQKTPVSVTAINSQTLDDNHVKSMLDVFNLVPSMQGTGQGDHGIVSITLRGIGNDSAKTEYADPEVALFVDGVFAPRPEGAATMLFDLDGIEVLRGPQGTLWGRNSTVGAINMKTAKPVLRDTSGYIEGGVGNYARMGIKGAVNIPLGDTIAARVAFAHEQHDGYVSYQRAPNVSLASQRAAYDAYVAGGGKDVGFQPINPNLFVQSGDKYNAQDQTAARLSFLIKPSDKLRWDISLEQFADRGTPSMSLMQTPREGEKFWSALIDTAPSLKRDSTSIRSRLEYDMGGMSLAYVAGYTHFKGSGTYDQDLGVNVPTSFTTGATYQADNTVWSKYTSHSHEVTLQSNERQTIDWVLGLYYAAEDNGIRFDIPIMNGTQQGTVNWQGSFIQPKETVDSSAAFGQATWNLSDAFHVTGGLRYTHDDRKNKGGRGWTWANVATAPQIPLNPSVDPTDPANGYTAGNINDAHYTGNKTTWLARAAYDLSKTTMVYASVSTGYKSGGTGDGGLAYGPETLTNYEAGYKSTLLDGRMTFNASVYHMKFKDFQFSAPVIVNGNRQFAYSNAEGAKVSGVEVEAAYLITPDDRLQLSASYTKTKLGALVASSNDYALPACTTLTGNCLDVTGNELPHAPKVSLQLMYEHNFPLSNGDSVAPRISYHYQSANWLSVFNLGDGDRQKAYSTADVAVRYSSKRNWYADLYVRNVGDEKIKTSAGSSGSYASAIWTAQYAAPRTFGLNAGYNF
ncbi:TonB-dependent receptor [Roseateles terrae]|uniref:Iron complex outermembrane receptor protein n=1 Tax=Roseateles terrae TaxID=431060 RepID=A0ABR6GUX1_9BURK|nr:TonB-dependent receptor [Roseateles terrae]MBB3195919.1 iron complex outermembrane receptor protein [Roseateles terrae]OWQ85167.1 TonB-dependent receptor [Roseateles terrae]